MKKTLSKVTGSIMAIALSLSITLGIAGAESNFTPGSSNVNVLVQSETANHPHYIQKLDNGNYLVCRVGHENPGVFELTPNGAEVWFYKGIIPNSAKRLGNGNTLIADSGAPGKPRTPRVIEVNPQGSIVWQYNLNSLAEAPRYAERLGNGNILITLPFEIREVNPSKSVVWRYGTGRPGKIGSLDVLSNPVQANRLGNGNTLVVDQGINTGRVFEVTPGGKVVWEYRGDKGNGKEMNLRKPKSATRLSDGTTMIVDRRTDRIIEVDSDAKAVRTYGWQQAVAGLPIMNIWYGQCLENGELLLTMTLTSQAGRIVEVGSGALNVIYDRDAAPVESIDNGQPNTPENGQWLP